MATSRRQSSYSTRCSARKRTIRSPGPLTGIVAAAGRGDRSGSDTPKQFLAVGGQSLVRRAVDLLQAAGCDPVLVVIPSGEPPPADVPQDGSVTYIEGGATRQESVANALERVTSEKVVVHDAARPLADGALLERVLVALEGVDGVTPGVPLDETIRRVADGASLETLDRTGVWRVQTPAAYMTGVLRRAHEQAVRDGFVGTDEAQLLERYGGRVAMVYGSRMNIKVTYPEDIDLVTAILGDQR